MHLFADAEHLSLYAKKKAFKAIFLQITWSILNICFSAKEAKQKAKTLRKKESETEQNGSKGDTTHLNYS